MNHRRRLSVLVLTCLVTLAIVVTAVPAEAKRGLDLHRGSRGPSVTLLEQRLARLGLLVPSAVDRRYRVATVHAVRHFQAQLGLRQTGRVKRGLWDLIAREPARRAAVRAPLVIGHRGAVTNGVTENTLQALQYAAPVVDYLEFDLQVTADHELVLMHDPTLDRTTNCSGAVASWTLADLQAQCRAGDQPIPTFDEAAALAEQVGRPVAPELKNGAMSNEDLQKVADVLTDHGLVSGAWLQSYYGGLLTRMRQLLPALHTVLVSGGAPSPGVVRSVGADAVAARISTLTLPGPELPPGRHSRVGLHGPHRRGDRDGARTRGRCGRHRHPPHGAGTLPLRLGANRSKRECATRTRPRVTRVYSGSLRHPARLVRAAVACIAVTLMLGAITAPASAAKLNLHKGSRNAAVKTLETRLHALGLLRARAVDRRYTKTTARAVRRFQRTHQLRATGRVNRTTWDAIARAAAPKPPPPPPPNPVLLAHRGGALEANVPENSISSLDYAVARGADILEFDLWATSDGQLVLMHDGTLDRTTTCTGLVSAKTLQEIQSQCFLQRARDGVATQERVPSYAEAAAYAQSVGKPIAPEIKIPNADLTDDEVAQFVQTTQDAGLATRTYLQSFEGGLVFPRVHALAPALATIFLTSYATNPATVTGAGSSIVAPEYHSVTADWLLKYHAAGLRVWTWTVDDAATMKRLWYMGSNGIFTDYPALARSLIR